MHPESKEWAKAHDLLIRTLEGCRKALRPYVGLREQDLGAWDAGMYRHYKRLEQDTLRKLEELEENVPGQS